MVDEEQAPSIDEKNAFKRTFDQSFHPFSPILELIGFSGHQLDILILPPIISDSPRLIVYLHDHHDQSSYCPSSCQTWPNDH